MTPDQQKLCADLRRLVEDSTMPDTDGKPCLTHDGHVIELALLEIERLAGRSEPMSEPTKAKVEWAVAFSKHLAHYTVRNDAEESAVALAAALASAQADSRRLDWLESKAGRVERMEPHQPSTLWKWFVFPKRYEPELGMNNIRHAIDAAIAAQAQRGGAE